MLFQFYVSSFRRFEINVFLVVQPCDELKRVEVILHRLATISVTAHAIPLFPTPPTKKPVENCGLIFTRDVVHLPPEIAKVIMGFLTNFTGIPNPQR